MPRRRRSKADNLRGRAELGWFVEGGKEGTGRGFGEKKEREIEKELMHRTPWASS